MLDTYFRGAAISGSGFAVFLATSAVSPTQDSNVKTDVTEIATGDGYSAGGINVNRDSTDFDVLTEDDTNDWALVQIKDIVWTASGGPIPASGNGARWALLTAVSSAVCPAPSIRRIVTSERSSRVIRPHQPRVGGGGVAAICGAS